MRQKRPEIGSANRLMRARSSSPESLPYRSREENRPLRDGLCSWMLLPHPGFSNADRQLTDAPDDAYAFRDTDCSSCIQNIEKVGAFKDLIVRRQQRKARFLRRIPRQKLVAFRLVF